jgi:hypothetical protein
MLQSGFIMKHKSLFLLRLVAAISTIFICSSVLAQVDPSIQWETMHLPHFDLIYDAKHQKLADLYADRLEDNLNYLGQEFKQLPEHVAVVLNDRTDLTNGYATAFPYRLIMIYPVLPPTLTTISDYGDWARELTMHETTHILSFESRRGIVKGLYYVFGSVMTPNLVLPRWWLEGIAVDSETRFSQHGRLRSPYQDASVRAYLVDHRWHDVPLGEINEVGIETWPQGARPYLFGSMMWSQMIADYGQKLVWDLHSRYGGRIPFLLEPSIYDATGKSYTAIYEEMLDDAEARGQSQLQTLQRGAPPPSETLRIDGALETFLPAVSPDGRKMVVITKDDSNRRAISVLTRPNLATPFQGEFVRGELEQRFNDDTGTGVSIPKQERLENHLIDDLQTGGDGPPTGTIQRLSWFSDSQKVVFDRVDTPDLFHETSDLWIFDLKKRRATQLTFGERAREADVSPDMRLIAFVGLGAGQTSLKLLRYSEQKSERKVETLAQPELQVRISNPTFWSNDEILYSERSPDGTERLKLFDLRTRSSREVLVGYPDIHASRKTPQGLLFTSILNGTSNAYLSADLKTAKPVSDTLTYVGSADMDPVLRDLYVTELSSRGLQTRRIAKADWEKLPAQLPKIGKLYADRYPSSSPSLSPASSLPSERGGTAPGEGGAPPRKEPPTTAYSPWRYLWPHYWIPNFSFSPDANYLGLITTGNDPLSKHVYALDAGYTSNDSRNGNYWNYDFQYLNQQTPAQIYLTAFDLHTWVPFTSVNYRDREQDAYALWTIPGFSSELFAGGGWTWISRNFTNDISSATYQNGPSLVVNYLDDLMSGRQFTPESGQSFNLKYTDFLSRGSNLDYRLLSFKGQKYFSRWLPAHNVIMVRAQGQWMDGPATLPDYATTSAIQLYSNLPSPFYIMRGYPTGTFLGRSLANYDLEYRFPIAEVNRGSGTTPIFIRQFHGAVVNDGISVDGYVFDHDSQAFEKVNKWKTFWNTGLELKADITLGYQIPLTVYAGVYWPWNNHFSAGNQYALGIMY